VIQGGDSILLIPSRLLTFLSTNVQRLDPSIQESTKLGLTKFDFKFYLRVSESFRYRLLDSIIQRLSAAAGPAGQLDVNTGLGSSC
jgi:hypothetical protein